MMKIRLIFTYWSLKNEKNKYQNKNFSESFNVYNMNCMNFRELEQLEMLLFINCKG